MNKHKFATFSALASMIAMVDDVPYGLPEKAQKRKPKKDKPPAEKLKPGQRWYYFNAAGDWSYTDSEFSVFKCPAATNGAAIRKFKNRP